MRAIDNPARIAAVWVAIVVKSLFMVRHRLLYLDSALKREGCHITGYFSGYAPSFQGKSALRPRLT